jgi:ABC-type dipeptide/oligopeptide/nickel transport system permease subunit
MNAKTAPASKGGNDYAAHKATGDPNAVPSAHLDSGLGDGLVLVGTAPRARLVWNWKMRIGIGLLLPIIVLAIFGSVIAPYSPTELGVGEPLARPSADHWLGTDFVGRDIASRLIVGSRITLILPLIVALITVVFALPVGLLAGYKGGRFDDIVMGFVDMLLSLPWILVALIVVSIRGPGLNAVIIALPIVFAPAVVRITRNSVRAVASMDFVDAARAIGESNSAIVLRYVLRNAYFPVLVLLTSLLGYSILIESALSYLGFGVQAPGTSWGLELATGADYLSITSHVVIFPGIAIALAVMAFSFLGDGLGDLLDASNEDG